MNRPQAPFRSFRRRGALLAAGISVFSAIALFFLYRYQEHIGSDVFGLLQNLLTVLLGIGLISLGYEVLLRESYGHDLRRFLRLRTALVTSGLQHIQSESTFEWPEVLVNAARVTALIRDPSLWLHANLPHILEAGRRRQIEVVIGLPDPEGPNVSQVSASVDLSRDDLDRHVRLAVQTVENQWDSNRGQLAAGSSIRVTAYREIPLYEVVMADNQVVCMLTKAVQHPAGDERLVLAFDQHPSQYPAHWLRSFLDVVEKANPLTARSIP